MRQYFAKHPNGNITTCNWPIQETGAESYEFDVKEADLVAAQAGTKDWKIEGGKLSVVASTRKAAAEAAKAQAEAERGAKKAELTSLKKKLEKGNATPEEVQIALSKLI
jgi:hypothetical protein